MFYFQSPTNFKNVEKTTVYQKKNMKNAETVVKQEEESLLVKWMFHKAKCGLPIIKEALLESVQMLLRQMDRVKPFTNRKPGRAWYELFLKRHSEILQRVTQLTKGIWAVTELKLKNM